MTVPSTFMDLKDSVSQILILVLSRRIMEIILYHHSIIGEING